MSGTGYYRFPAINLINKYDPTLDDATLGEIFGIARQGICRWRLENVCLSAYQADKYAIRVGWHPSSVWDDWWEPFETVLERRARCERERWKQKQETA